MFKLNITVLITNTRDWRGRLKVMIPTVKTKRLTLSACKLSNSTLDSLNVATNFQHFPLTPFVIHHDMFKLSNVGNISVVINVTL